ncbi:MAG: hypothetical protein FJW39_07175 [Acidobacteria bacterium]|nr:hypothetical protein [Acidobacteriota bacterium]
MFRLLPDASVNAIARSSAIAVVIFAGVVLALSGSPLPGTAAMAAGLSWIAWRWSPPSPDNQRRQTLFRAACAAVILLFSVELPSSPFGGDSTEASAGPRSGRTTDGPQVTTDETAVDAVILWPEPEKMVTLVAPLPTALRALSRSRIPASPDGGASEPWQASSAVLLLSDSGGGLQQGPLPVHRVPRVDPE